MFSLSLLDHEAALPAGLSILERHQEQTLPRTSSLFLRRLNAIFIGTGSAKKVVGAEGEQ
jgi:hypothetical protein